MAGEWKEAVWKEVWVSLSQKGPRGGLVFVKNIPVDHLSKRKLHVSEKSYKTDKMQQKFQHCPYFQVFVQIIFLGPNHHLH